MPDAVILDKGALWVMSGFGSVAILVFGAFLSNLTSQIDKIKEEVTKKLDLSDHRSEEIETNYNTKFEKVYSELDNVHEKLDIVVEKVAEQTGYCQAIQTNKKKENK